jgi:hypothetical protein
MAQAIAGGAAVGEVGNDGGASGGARGKTWFGDEGKELVEEAIRIKLLNPLLPEKDPQWERLVENVARKLKTPDAPRGKSAARDHILGMVKTVRSISNGYSTATAQFLS